MALVFFYKTNYVQHVLLIFAFYFSIQLTITLLLLADFYIKTKNTVVQFSKNKLNYQINDVRYSFEIEEIETIIIHCAPSIKRNSRVIFFPFEPFHYILINLNNGQKVYITSLSDSNLNSSIKSISILKGKIFYLKRGFFNNGAWINSPFLDAL
ncbi:hypothetical protein ULMS_02180 [Patiriisocius marinistellae]|uniref:PH domain-containing protein n=2 Tax=Patiriisocius marinistellae TaxID=2494560 RepID=A0A5J4FT58_9FLAO|nr:hypothetical protein ULMS_02180 [Patiriisocius marinistellae]